MDMIIEIFTYFTIILTMTLGVLFVYGKIKELKSMGVKKNVIRTP